MTPLAKAQSIALAALNGVAGVSFTWSGKIFTGVPSDGSTVGAPWEAKTGIDSAVYVTRGAIDGTPEVGDLFESGGKRFRVVKIVDLPADAHIVYQCRVSDG